MSFLTNFFKAGGGDAMEGVQSALAQAAPNLAGKAQLATMDQDLDAIGKTISEFRKDLREATVEHDHVAAQYGEFMGGAEVMQSQIAELEADIAKENEKPEADRNQAGLTAWTTKKVSLSTSLNNLVGQVEHIVPTLDRDKARVEKLTQQLHTAEELYKTRAEEMVNSGSELEEAKHDMKAANLDEQRAQQDADNARRLAGLATSSGNGLTVATDSFKRATEAARQRTEALDLKSSTLTAVKTASKGDENIQAAIAAAKGTTSTATFTDRLAALKR